MKIGIEEEFIVVDPETLFYTPGVFRLATGLVYRDSSYVRKCSIELPWHSGSFGDILQNLGMAFSVFEIKTDPYEDIDRLKNELSHHRKNLADVARDNHLMVLPTGLHPLYSPDCLIPDNCAAMHVHVDYHADVFDRLFAKIPFLISISANSPFIKGKPGVLSNRMNYSPHIGIPKDQYRRRSDLIHNTYFDTVEVRMLDSQITVNDSIGLASIIKAIAEQEGSCRKLNPEDYKVQRQKAISGASLNCLIPPEEYEKIRHYNEYTKQFLEERTGSEWQLTIFDKYNLSSVIVSLWESFSADKRTITPSDAPISNDNPSLSDLLFLIPYFPFFVIDKYTKYRHDMMSVSKLIVSRAKKNLFNH